MSRTLATTVTAALVLVAGILLFGSMFTVQQTQQALVLQFGEPRGVIVAPGLHFKVPMVQNVVYLDKRVLFVNAATAEVIASDQKRLVVDSYLRYRIVDPLLFYQAVRTQPAADARLQTILESSLRQELGKVPLTSIVSDQRVALMQTATRLTGEQAKAFGIEVVDVRITRTDLPDENSQAIFARMRAERQREAAEFRAQGAEQGLGIRANADRDRTVLLAEARKTAEIARGQGDAEAIRTFANAFGTDIDFFTFYRSMQAYREVLPGPDTTLVLSPNTDFLRYLRSIGGELAPGAGPAR